MTVAGNGNFVSVSVRALDEAKPDLDALRAKLEELQGKVAAARADVDTKDGDAKLIALEAQLDAVSKRIASPRIDMAGASRALAQVAAVDVALDRLEDKSESAGKKSGENFSGGFLEENKGKLITAGIGTALAALPALAAAGGALAGAGFGAAFLLKTNPAAEKAGTSLVSTLKGVMTQATAPLVKPLEDAFRQIGQFAKSIEPELKAVFSAVGPMIAPLAQGLEGLVKGALPGFVTLMKAAQPAVSALAGVLGALGKGLGGMLSAMAPAVRAAGSVLGALGSVIGTLAPLIGQIAGTLASALAPVLKTVAGVVSRLAPVIGTVAGVFAQIAAALLPVLAGALQQLLPPLAGLVEAIVSGLAPVLVPLAGMIAKVAGALLGGLVQAVTALMPGLMQLVQALLKLLTTVVVPLIGPLTQLALALVKIVLAVTPVLPPVLQLVTLLVELAAKALTPLTGLLTLVAGMLAKLAGGIAIVVGAVAKIVSAGLKWIENFGNVKKIIADVFDWIKGHWPLLLAVFTGPVGLAVLFITQHFSQIRSGAEKLVGDVVSFFKGLPGKIISALGDVGSLLLSSGEKIVQGLINGIGNMAGSLGSAVEHDVVGVIKSFLPFSPAKRGPLSGAGAPENSGKSIARLLAQGMTSGAAGVRQAAAHLAGSAAVAGAGSAAFAGGGTASVHTVQLQFTGSGSDMFERWFRQRVRVIGGGSVQKAFGYGSG